MKGETPRDSKKEGTNTMVWDGQFSFSPDARKKCLHSDFSNVVVLRLHQLTFCTLFSRLCFSQMEL